MCNKISFLQLASNILKIYRYKQFLPFFYEKKKRQRPTTSRCRHIGEFIP